MELLNITTLVIGVFGIIVIAWGSLTVFLEFLKLEFTKCRGINICKKRELLRHHLGSYLLIGLEFMIAADIIRTIVEPDTQELITLATLVAIRTLISYFLNKELRDSHVCWETA